MWNLLSFGKNFSLMYACVREPTCGGHDEFFYFYSRSSFIFLSFYFILCKDICWLVMVLFCCCWIFWEMMSKKNVIFILLLTLPWNVLEKNLLFIPTLFITKGRTAGNKMQIFITCKKSPNLQQTYQTYK